MSKCISIHGEYSEHEYTTKPICDYCGQISEMIALAQLQVMRTALEQIQELHNPYITKSREALCLRCGITWPCSTRKLADEGLTDRMARTNQGENNE